MAGPSPPTSTCMTAPPSGSTRVDRAGASHREPRGRMGADPSARVRRELRLLRPLGFLDGTFSALSKQAGALSYRRRCPAPVTGHTLPKASTDPVARWRARCPRSSLHQVGGRTDAGWGRSSRIPREEQDDREQGRRRGRIAHQRLRGAGMSTTRPLAGRHRPRDPAEAPWRGLDGGHDPERGERDHEHAIRGWAPGRGFRTPS